jgi:hypothetical protein
VFRTREKTRVLEWFFLRPALPFAIEFLLLAPLVIGLDVPGVEPLYLVVAPFLLLAVALLNLPFVGGAFRAFRMDRATRRNHALEHATIHYLRHRGRRRLAGQASSKGFRVSGGASAVDIRAAFEQVRQVVRDSRPLPHISRHCGSNRVTALGLAMLLLFGVTVACVVFRPPLAIRGAALTAVVAAFLGLRHRVGDWIQRRCFMATDFVEVSVRDIRKVTPEHGERPPVFFVETIVRPQTSREVDAPSRGRSSEGLLTGTPEP